MTVSPTALAQQAVGPRGVIVGEQVIGKMDSRHPAHSVMVPDGKMMSLTDNARAQKMSVWPSAGIRPHRWRLCRSGVLNALSKAI